ncbi:unnamed protein product [Paramecium octaurelia]|uniref:Uncharacterized protein n=1 Tax=Paramecium octaurelia TaxID=43137 RepID=A0A8S1XES0_PAROT|nr:unnamed protein product [Paramecium octaurelia]
MNDRLLNGSGSQDLYTMLHTGDRFYHIMVWLSFCNVFAILTTNIFFNMAQFLIQWEAIPAVVSSCLLSSSFQVLSLLQNCGVIYNQGR